MLLPALNVCIQNAIEGSILELWEDIDLKEHGTKIVQPLSTTSEGVLWRVEKFKNAFLKRRKHIFLLFSLKESL